MKKMRAQQHTSKKVKERDEMDVDRLSNLPDAIIHHILTFMDTKYAVQTCVLSKRWNNLWIHLPSLTFNSKSFTRIASFRNFVLHVLDHHKASNLCSFSLLRKLKVDEFFMKRVIDFAVSHHVQQLHISSTRSRTPCSPRLRLRLYNCGLPLSLYACHSLRVFKLEHCYRIINLRSFLVSVSTSLTTLHLNSVNFILYKYDYIGIPIKRKKNDLISINLFSSCLNLENLFLTECSVDTYDDFIISGPRLGNLTISNMRIRQQRQKGKVMVSAPRLTSFNFTANTNLRLSVDSCPNLDTVNIHVEVSNNQNRKRKYIFSLIKIFKKLSNAKSVTLSLETLKVLSMVPGLLENQPSPFNNLKSLKVKVTERMKSFTIPLHVMTFLLSGSPNAETMVVELSKA